MVVKLEIKSYELDYNSEGSGKVAWVHRFASAFVGPQWHKYQTFINWPVSDIQHIGKASKSVSLTR